MIVTPAFAQEAPQAETGEGEVLHTETAQDVGHEGVFPPFNTATYPSQILWLAIIFGLFYIFLKRMVLPRIASTLEVRRDRIAQDLDQAARMRQEADEATAAYEQELADARSKAHRMSEEARNEAREKANRERSELEQELETKLQDAETRIEQVRSEAMAEVDTIATDTAEAMIQHLLGSADRGNVASAVDSAKQKEDA